MLDSCIAELMMDIEYGNLYQNYAYNNFATKWFCNNIPSQSAVSLQTGNLTAVVKTNFVYRGIETLLGKVNMLYGVDKNGTKIFIPCSHMINQIRYVDAGYTRVKRIQTSQLAL